MKDEQFINIFRQVLFLVLSLILINKLIALYSYIFTHSFAYTDDPQHVHIAWNISQGKIIYRDFFEHHGPLYAFFNGSILTFLNEPASFSTLLLLRKLSFLTACTTGLVTFFLSKYFLKDNLAGLFTVVIYSSWHIVQESAIHIRPDLLQSLFLTLGLYLLLRFKTNKLVQICSELLFHLRSCLISRR